MAKRAQAVAEAMKIINEFKPSMNLNPYAEGYTHDSLAIHPALKGSEHHRKVKSFRDFLIQYQLDTNNGTKKTLSTIGKHGLEIRKGMALKEIDAIELMFQDPVNNPPPKTKLRTFGDYFMFKMFKQMEVMESEEELKKLKNCKEVNSDMAKENVELKNALKKEKQEHEKTKTSLKRALETIKEMKEKKARSIQAWKDRKNAQKAKAMELASQIKFDLVKVEKFEPIEEEKEEKPLSSMEQWRLERAREEKLKMSKGEYWKNMYRTVKNA